MEEKRTQPVFGIGVFPFLAGAGTTIQWKLRALGGLLGADWAGSAAAAAIGVAVLACLVFTGIRSLRSWAIILAAFALDQLLTLFAAWPVRHLVVADPLGPWPYIIGTATTFVAGIVVGILAPQAPVRHALGMVALDSILAGAGAFVTPLPLTYKLLSRVLAGYCAASCGAAIGQYCRGAVRKDQESVGKLMGTVTITLITSVAGGVATALLLELARK